MISGNPNRIAIEAELRAKAENGWLYGGIRLWLREVAVGDWEDMADLGGFVQTLRRFYETAPERYESSLDNLSAEEIHRRVGIGVLAAGAHLVKDSETIASAFSRFHISHIGMSSFDRVTMLLVKDRSGNERVIWTEIDNEVREVWLEPNEMERVAEEFVHSFGKELL